MSCKFLLQARTTIYGIHAYVWLILGCFTVLLFVLCPELWPLHELSYSCNARSSVPMPTVLLALLFTLITFIIAIAVFTLLLLLLHHCCHHITVATNKLCQASIFPGVTELTTQLLRLIGILWLPLCRINKLGYTYHRRLLRSPTLVGHQHPTPTLDILKEAHRRHKRRRRSSE